jgi:hypothetical protein
MQIKQCTSCKQELQLDMFHKSSRSKDGYNSICKECKAKIDREYREKNQDTIKARKKKYYQDNKDSISLKSAEYRLTHKEEKAAQDKRYAQEHKEKIQQYQKEYRDSHKLSNAEYQKQYREKNKDKLDEYKKSPHVRYTVYKRNAKKKNRNLDLTEDEFIKMSKQPCVYCGGYSDTYNGDQFNGIDRFDSNLGYSLNNCVPCCATCNRMKMDLPVNDWINKMKQIIEYIGRSDSDA